MIILGLWGLCMHFFVGLVFITEKIKEKKK